MAQVSVTASQLWVSEMPRYFFGATSAKNAHICICYCHICVLLKKTNSMIYNMLYKIWYSSGKMRARCRRRRARCGGLQQHVVGGCQGQGNTLRDHVVGLDAK